jgi:AcrR family transcriptional regulator
MVVSRQDTGRTNQKQRTRRAIIEAAAELLRENRTPTVADAAERALVSRATAYRYFPSQQSLLIELQADATQPSPDAVLAGVGDDIEARAEAIIRAITKLVLADEAFFRTQLRVIQELWFARDGDASMPVREGRRLSLIDAALEPVARTLSRSELAPLRTSLALVVGVEPVISLRDVCGLSPKATEEALVRTGRAIVRESLSGRL